MRKPQKKPKTQFEAYLPLANKQAARFLWTGIPKEELQSVAAVGLGRAIQRFDPLRHNNGIAAYAIPWIDGELKKFVTATRSIVAGGVERHERGEYPPRASIVEYFGNVAIGDGTKQPDVLHDAPIVIDGNEIGSAISNHPDHRLGGVLGDRYWESVTRYMSDRDRRIVLMRRADCTLRVIAIADGRHLETVRRVIKDAGTTFFLVELDEWSWPGLDAQLFRRECLEVRRHGVGHFYRSRLTESERRLVILPYVEPSWTRKCKRVRTPGCTCIGCWPTKLLPREEYRRLQDRLWSHLRRDESPEINPVEYAKSQDDWKGWKHWKRNPPARWKVAARAALKRRQTGMFWSDDGLSQYEIWSQPTYSPVGLEAWCYVGHVNKRRVKAAGEELVLKRTIKTGVIMKQGWRPDARQLNHGSYWRKEDDYAEAKRA